MKLALVVAVVALAVVWQGVPTQAPPPPPPFLKPKNRCAAEAHQCYLPFPFRPRFCRRRPIRPVCRAFRHRRCRQRVTRLRKVWVQFGKGKFAKVKCCRVINCPRIYYSDCTYKQDRCPFFQSLCAPERYRRRLLYLRCPGIRKVLKTYRYFPHCCVCQFCPLSFFPIF